MHECSNDNIVNFHGAFLSNTGDVVMCMEYMDCGYIYLLCNDSTADLGQIARSYLKELWPSPR